MRRFADQGGIDTIQTEIIARNLHRRFRLRTADGALAATLAFLECNPDVAGPAPRDVMIMAEKHRGRICILEEDTVVKETLCEQAALEYLHMRLFGYSLADRPQATIVHAASLRRRGQRFLLVGSKGVGKSTLTLRLIQAGFEFEGDEHVFVENARVIARPRACRIRDASLAYLPEIAKTIESSPFFQNYDGQRIFSLDPRRLGAEWRIEEGEARHIFALQPNHGGYSSIRPMSPSALVQFLVPETGWRDKDRGRSVASLAALARQAKAFDLSLGDHPTAIRCIDCALDR
jgi:hypothetical protein